MKWKKFVSTILCLAYFNSSIARADQIGDLEKQVDAAIENYRQIVQQLLVLEKTSIAPTHVKQGIVNSFGLTQTGMAPHIESINADFKSLANESDVLNTKLEEIRKSAKSVTIDGYQNLLSQKYAAELSIARMRSLHSNIENRIKTLRSLIKGADGYCEKLSRKLDPENAPLESPSAIVSRMQFPPYQGIDPKAFYGQSPFARGNALIAGGVTFVAAVFLYASIETVTVFVAAKTLFALGFESAGVTLSGSGWGAVIIFAAVAVAYFAGTETVEHENAEAQKRRDKALKKLTTEIESLQNHYKQSRMTKAQFQSLGLELCQAEEKEKKSDGTAGLIFAKNQEWSNKIMEMDEASTQMATVIESLKETDENLQKIAKQQEQFLKEQIEDEVVIGINAKSLDQAKVANGWLLYNENMKPIWNRFNDFYISNMGDCFALLVEEDLKMSELTAASQTIKAELAGIDSLGSELTAQVSASVNLVTSSIKNRMKTCY